MVTPTSSINNKWFVNLSNTNIPLEVSKLLQLGGKFSLPDSTNKKLTIHKCIKDLENNIRRFNVLNPIAMRNSIIPELRRIAQNKGKVNPTEEKLKSSLNSTICYCRNNIIFTQADKGNAPVAMDSKNYYNKMEQLLSDKDTYAIIEKDPLIKN